MFIIILIHLDSKQSKPGLGMPASVVKWMVMMNAKALETDAYLAPAFFYDEISACGDMGYICYTYSTTIWKTHAEGEG